MDDILVNADIKIKNGDLAVGFSDGQNIEYIISAKPGQFYQFPTLGVGIIDEINSSISKQELEQKIKNNLEADNYRINRIDVGGNLDELLTKIDAVKLK